MSISFDTIPASIRKPGVYIEFNTSLAVRTLPTNKQSVCLIVPLGVDATVAANVPTPFYSAAEAKALFGGTVAGEMADAFISANRYASLSAVGVVVTGETEPDIKAALDSTAMGGFTILVPAWFSQIALTALRTHIQTYTSSMEQQGIIGVAALTSTLSAATTLATSLNSGAISLAVLPGTASTARQVAAAGLLRLVGDHAADTLLVILHRRGLVGIRLAKQRLHLTEPAEAKALGEPHDGRGVHFAFARDVADAVDHDAVALLAHVAGDALELARQALVFVGDQLQQALGIDRRAGDGVFQGGLGIGAGHGQSFWLVLLMR